MVVIVNAFLTVNALTVSPARLADMVVIVNAFLTVNAFH